MQNRSMTKKLLHKTQNLNRQSSISSNCAKTVTDVMYQTSVRLPYYIPNPNSAHSYFQQPFSRKDNPIHVGYYSTSVSLCCTWFRRYHHQLRIRRRANTNFSQQSTWAAVAKYSTTRQIKVKQSMKTVQRSQLATQLYHNFLLMEHCPFNKDKYVYITNEAKVQHLLLN